MVKVCLMDNDHSTYPNMTDKERIGIEIAIWYSVMVIIFIWAMLILIAFKRDINEAIVITPVEKPLPSYCREYKLAGEWIEDCRRVGTKKSFKRVSVNVNP